MVPTNKMTTPISYNHLAATSYLKQSSLYCVDLYLLTANKSVWSISNGIKYRNSNPITVLNKYVKWWNRALTSLFTGVCLRWVRRCLRIYSLWSILTWLVLIVANSKMNQRNVLYIHVHSYWIIIENEDVIALLLRFRFHEFQTTLVKEINVHRRTKTPVYLEQALINSLKAIIL